MICCPKFIFYSLLFLSLILFSCAEVASPPGGPKDETAPTITSTIPLSGRVNTNNDNKITLSFSESVDKKGVEEAIFITPRQKDKLKYSWKKHSLSITLPESFKSNTTYVVSIGTGVKDLHGNRMEESFSFAFSTGENIDNGKVSGLIFQENKPKAGMTLGLFDYSVLDSLNFLDSLYPPYMTQSGKNGEFEFDYLPNRKYFILAFDDKNKNQLFNYPAELFGLADRFVVIDTVKNTLELNINMTAVDTTSLAIISAAQTPYNLIKVRLSKKVKSETVNEYLNDISLISENKDNILAPSSVMEKEGESSVFNFYLANLQDGVYTINIGSRLSTALNGDSAFLESAKFEVQINADSVPPQINYFSGGQKEIFPDENSFEIGFSEPMNQIIENDSSILIYDDADIPKEITFDWIDDFRLGLTLDKPEWGKKYFVVLDEKEFIDLAGNSLGDSISVFMFDTYNSDSLGEASGTIEFGEFRDSNVVSYLTFNEIYSNKSFSKKFDDNHFNFSLPSGKYLISGFIDKNRNGFYDSGSILPFKLAETFAMGRDTVRVRARFETAGLTFEFK